MCWFYSNLFVCVCVYGFIWKWKPWSVVTSSISSVPSFSIHIRVKCCHKLLTSLWRVWQRFSTIYDRFYCFGWKHLILYCYGYIIIRLIIIVFDHWFEKITQYIENVVQQKRHTHKHMNFVGFILLTIHLNRYDRSVWNVNVLYVLRMNGKQLQTVYRFHSLLYSVVQHTHDPTESHKSQQFISISRLVSIFVLCVCVCLLKGGGTRLSTFWCYLVSNQRNRNLNCLTFNFISVFLSFRSHPKRSYYKR